MTEGYERLVLLKMHEKFLAHHYYFLQDNRI